MDMIELIKKILEENGPCSIEQLLNELLKRGKTIKLEELFNLINSCPTIFKWTNIVLKDGIIIIPQKVTLAGVVVKLPQDQNPHHKN